MPEIIKEWVGYNGKMTEEKKPDGSVKKTKHNKVWAVALTDTGHLYVRYGPAKHPLKLTEQIIRPRRGTSEHEALSAAEQLFQEKVQEKLHQKGYEAISFEAPPQYVPSFSQWRMSDEPEELVAPVHEVMTLPHEEGAVSLQQTLQEMSQYLLDLGDGHTYTPALVLSKLSRTEEGRAWLTAPCLHREHALLHAETQEVLAMLIDLTVEEASPCGFKSAGAQK